MGMPALVFSAMDSRCIRGFACKWLKTEGEVCWLLSEQFVNRGSLWHSTIHLLSKTENYLEIDVSIVSASDFQGHMRADIIWKRNDACWVLPRGICLVIHRCDKTQLQLLAGCDIRDSRGAVNHSTTTPWGCHFFNLNNIIPVNGRTSSFLYGFIRLWRQN